MDNFVHQAPGGGPAARAHWQLTTINYGSIVFFARVEIAGFMRRKCGFRQKNSTGEGAMRRTFFGMIAALGTKLGRCPSCMRQAFLAALAAVTILLLAWAIIGIDEITYGALVVAVALSALWIAHLVAFAVRSAAPSAPRISGAPSIPRREIVPTFAKALAFMALATILPASRAAAGCCDCTKCSSNQVCCKTANGCCGCFPASIKCP